MDVPIPSQVPLFWVPSAVVARLTKEYSFAVAPHIGWRRWLFTGEVRQLAAEELGIRVQKPRSLAQCPQCGSWVSYLELERGRWTCRRCALWPARGLMVRIAWFACYRRLGVWDRHMRSLRRGLAVRLLRLAQRPMTVDTLVLFSIAAATLGPWPSDWRGPRRPRRQLAHPARYRSRGPEGPVDNHPGPLHQRLAGPLLDGIIDALLDRHAYAARFGAEAGATG
jgi:hypothetical protein